MTTENHMDEARQFAAQCWCDEETKDRVMDPALCEAVAKRIAVWMDTAAIHCKNEFFYRNLVHQCAESLGPLREQAFVQDDGGIVDTPLALKVPELVSKLAADALKWKLVNETATAPRTLATENSVLNTESGLRVELLKAEDIHDDLQIDCDEFFGDG